MEGMNKGEGLHKKGATSHHLTEFKKPALSVWVEEGMCQVITIILRDLEGFIFNTFIQILK